MTVHVLAYDTANPGDVSALSQHLQSFLPETVRRLALLVKTEGNSDLNDFSREFAMLAAQQALTRWGGEGLLARCTFLFSTGCEGAMTPLGYLFVDVEGGPASSPAGEKRLVIGCAHSRSLHGEEVGTPAHAEIVAVTVRAAMRDARVEAADVALVIVKTPVMSHLETADTGKKKKRITSAYSKAVGALGAGVALGEVDLSRVKQQAFNEDHDLHSRRAMVFSGSELDRVEIMLLANRPGSAGSFAVHTGYMRDMLDAGAIRTMLREAGCEFDAAGQIQGPERVVAMLVKGGVSPDGYVRGNRTTIKTSHLDMDKHVRATLSGVIGSTLGHCRAFISANTVHQAPPGGGLCACIVRMT